MIHGKDCMGTRTTTKVLSERNHSKVARRERWPPRNDKEVLTPSSAKIEADEKKMWTTTVEEDLDKISFGRMIKEGVQGSPSARVAK